MIRKGFRTYVERASPTLSFPYKYLPNSTRNKRKRWIHVAFFMDVLQKQASRPLDIHQLETPTTPVGEITLPRCLCVRWQGRDVDMMGPWGGREWWECEPSGLAHMTKLRNSNPNESEKHRNSSLITSSFEPVIPLTKGFCNLLVDHGAPMCFVLFFVPTCKNNQLFQHLYNLGTNL